jgi:hypothetical protein
MSAPLQTRQTELWPTDRLVFYTRNPRKIDAAADRMCASIREFGFKVPVLPRSDGTVVDGHLRIKAARKLSLSEIPVILCDEWSEASEGFPAAPDWQSWRTFVGLTPSSRAAWPVLKYKVPAVVMFQTYGFLYVVSTFYSFCALFSIGLRRIGVHFSDKNFRASRRYCWKSSSPRC